MSLINDALKRAKQAQVRPPPVPLSEPGLEPVVAPAAGPIRPGWLIPAGAFMVLLLAFWFLSLWWRASQMDAAAAQAKSESTNRVAEVMSAVQLTNSHPGKPVSLPTAPSAFVSSRASPSPDVSRPTQPASAPPNPQLNHAAEPILASPVHTPESRADQAAPPPAPAEPETNFKLQGIFYRSSQASAVINGKAMFVGDEIDGATLVSIERQAVRLTQRGRTNVLKLH